jgi:hypothetical protein
MRDPDPLLVDAKYRSSDEILAHPLFVPARNAFGDAVLDLYEGDQRRPHSSKCAFFTMIYVPRSSGR